MIYYQSDPIILAACVFQQLDHVVNGAPGHSLHTESLILATGRLLLDIGLSHNSRRCLINCVEPQKRRHQPDLSARAAVLLSLAYLAAGQIPGSGRNDFCEQDLIV